MTNRRGPGHLVSLLLIGLAMLLSSRPVRAVAPYILLTPAGAHVDQGSLLSLTATVVNEYQSNICHTLPGQPDDCHWRWSVSGGGWVSGSTYGQTNSYGTFTAATTAGAFTITVSRDYVDPVSVQVTVNPVTLVLSGPPPLPQNESGRLTATFSGRALPFDTSLTWSIVGFAGGVLTPDGSNYGTAQMATFTAGNVAGTYTVKVQSVAYPSLMATVPVAVLPPPLASISPTSAVTTAGTNVEFTGTVFNSSNHNLAMWTDDPNGYVNQSSYAAGTYTHRPGFAGGNFHVTAASVLGGTPAVASVSVVTLGVSPASVVVVPGAPRQFLASLAGSQQALQWSTTIPGTVVSPSGLLLVPVGTAAGAYSLKVQTAGAPVVMASAALTVGGAVPVAGVTVSPARSVIDSGQQEPFSALVQGQNGEPNPNQAVQWSISGPAPGTIGASGLFTAPATPGLYTVTATSVADPSKSGSALVTVGEDLMILPSWASVAPGGSQIFQAHVTGVSSPAIAWSVQEGAAGGTVSASGTYQAPPLPGVFHVVALSSSSGQGVRGVATVVVKKGPAIVVGILPTSIELNRSATQQFTASVSGASDTSVVWSASAGAIDQTGLYTASATLGTVTVTATSHANGLVRASATVIVSNGGASTQLQYDANGNLLFDGTRSFEWDAANRLTAVTNGGHRSEFGYDGAGHRAMIVERDGGTVTSKRHYVWVGNDLAEERDATGTAATLPTALARSPGLARTAALLRRGQAAVETGGLASERSKAIAASGPAVPLASGNNAGFVSQSVPASMTAGGVYNASVTLLNTGTTTWTAAAYYRLGSSNPQNNSTWGIGRVYLGANESVAPGQQKTFLFNVTAPASTGNYNFQWQLLQENAEWIGSPTPNRAVSVAVGAISNVAQFIAQSLPTAMVAGGLYSASVTFQNVGTKTWTQASNHSLGSLNPKDNSTWGFSRVFLGATDAIGQGQQKTFIFNVRAPAAAGTYNFQWQMVQDVQSLLGDATPNVAVVVNVAPNSLLEQFISQSVPTVMSVGVSYPVAITLQNAGSATWTLAGNYRLGSQNPENNQTWGLSRVYLGPRDNIGRGQQQTFSFTVTAPSVPGTYNFQWQMVQEGLAWLPEPTPNTQISVVLPVEPVLARFFPFGMQSGGANYYYSYDHLGSVREVTDASGAVVSRYDYDPYGRLTVNQGVPPRLGFAGYFYHSPSALSLTHYRAYDPNLGRWLSRDPIHPNDGYNAYTYVADDPINGVDPLGLRKCPDPVKPKPKVKWHKGRPMPKPVTPLPWDPFRVPLIDLSHVPTGEITIGPPEEIPEWVVDACHQSVSGCGSLGIPAGFFHGEPREEIHRVGLAYAVEEDSSEEANERYPDVRTLPSVMFSTPNGGWSPISPYP